MDIPSWSRVGAKVVCINNKALPGHVWSSLPQPRVGSIYTVTRMFISPIDGSPVVRLMELPETEPFDGGYLISRFRPLITQQDDIEAHFRVLLDVRNTVDA